MENGKKEVAYTLNGLLAQNPNYAMMHWLDEKDLNEVNRLVELIEGSRADTPRPGDIIRYTNRYGSYYPTARIERLQSDIPSSICMQGNLWVHFRDGDDTTMSFSVGCGGPFVNDIHTSLLIPEGKKKAWFRIWSHLGPCEGGALDFMAEVNVWRYYEPRSLVENFSTEHWDRRYISEVKRQLGNGPSLFEWYNYLGNGIAFKSEAELNAWVKTYRGYILSGNSDTQKVVFLYRSEEHLVSRKEWDGLDLPMDTRQCNGIITVKVMYDDVNHVVHEYRYTNTGRHDKRGDKPFAVARGGSQGEIAESAQ